MRSWEDCRRYCRLQEGEVMDRLCNDCGQTFPDTGDDECPNCGSNDTFCIDELDFESEEE